MANPTSYKKLARILLGGRCVKCGATENLCFDHIDTTTKTRRTQDVFKGSWARVKRELTLLQLLCKSCHDEKSRYDRQITAGQRPYWEHGSITGYYIHGCREECCQEARRQYQQQRQSTR